MEKVYAKGMITFAKNQKAPDFVLGTLVITPKQLLDWINGEGSQYATEYKGDKQIKLTLLAGKDKVNIQVDTYKATPKAETAKTADDYLPF